jgi:hypothetical protein
VRRKIESGERQSLPNSVQLTIMIQLLLLVKFVLKDFFVGLAFFECTLQQGCILIGTNKDGLEVLDLLVSVFDRLRF